MTRSAALVTVLVALAGFGGTLAGVWLTQRGEERRQRLSVSVRTIELEHEHRARLLEGRLAAYQRFNSAFLEHRRAQRTLAIWWGHSQSVAAEFGKGSTDPDLGTRFDYAQERLTVALDAWEAASRALADSLAGVELVASAEVYTAADRLGDLSSEAWVAHREWANKTHTSEAGTVDLWIAVEQAEKAVLEGRNALRQAIRAELKLG